MRSIVRLMLRHTRSNTLQRNAGERRDGVTFSPPTITAQAIRDLILQQGGRCAISGVPLVFAHNSDWCCSLERVDTTRGYDADNVIVSASSSTARSHGRLRRSRCSHRLCTISLLSLLI